MSKELIVWKEAIANAGLTDLGVCFELFKTNKMLFIKKDNDKRAVLMFKDEEANRVATVVCSGDVNRAIRAGKVSLAQALSLNVLVGKYKNTGDEVMWLSFPAKGWADVVAPEAINYEDLAL